LTFLFVGLFTYQFIRTFNTLTSPELHVCGSARTLDCCALPVTACESWPVELHLMPKPPVVQNPDQILVPTRPRYTTSEGPWLNPDLVGKWSHSPAKALPFLPQAQTNTILILNPSSNPLYVSSLNFPHIFTCAKRNQTNLKCPPFSACYFMTHSLTTHFFFCV